MKYLSLAVLALFMTTPAMSSTNAPSTRSVTTHTTIRSGGEFREEATRGCNPVVHVDSKGNPLGFAKNYNFITCRIQGGGPPASVSISSRTTTVSVPCPPKTARR